jgi:hypothetical protein
VSVLSAAGAIERRKFPKSEKIKISDSSKRNEKQSIMLWILNNLYGKI